MAFTQVVRLFGFIAVSHLVSPESQGIATSLTFEVGPPGLFALDQVGHEQADVPIRLGVKTEFGTPMGVSVEAMGHLAWSVDAAPAAAYTGDCQSRAARCAAKAQASGEVVTRTPELEAAVLPLM